MTSFSYSAPAELFSSRRYAKSTQQQYRRFATASEAIRFIIEELPGTWLNGSILEVDESRFEGAEIRALYESPDFPRPRQPAVA